MAFQEKFNMFDVQYLLGIKTIQKSGSTRYVECPFCNTTSLCCNMTENFYNCMSCGKGGNYYQLYADVMGIKSENGLSATKIARREILEKLGNGPVRTYESVPKKEEKAQSKKSAKELDLVYRTMIEYLSLSDKHYKALRKRGLNDNQIKRYGFRTLGSASGMEVAQKLIKRNLNLEGVPGFAKIKGRWELLNKNDGYLCPAFNEEGLLIGFQTRLDNPVNEKYKWLSSKEFACGTSSGSPAALYGPKDCEIVVVVDGILKALVCRCLCNREDIGFLGVAGVNNYKNCSIVLKKLAFKGTKMVVNAFDMDEFTNTLCMHDYKKCMECNEYNNCYYVNECEYKKKKVKNLKNGSEHLKKVANELGLEYKRLTWDLNNNIWQETIKGLDDGMLELGDKLINI